MLSKSKRLNLKKDFKWVASGKRVDGIYASVFIRMGQNNSPLLGIAISSKHFKKAHERNRVRRIISSALEVLYSRLPANINIVVLPKSSIAHVKSEDVLLDLEEVVKKYNLLIK